MIRKGIIFKDKKLEGFVIASYIGGKLVFWSKPTIGELAVVAVCVLCVRFCKLFPKLHLAKILKEWLFNIDLALAKFFERFLFPKFEPNQLIQWLTGGKFSVNVACKEKTPFFKPNPAIVCKRKACRFELNRRKMPKTMQKGWLADLFTGNIFMSKYLWTFKQRELSSPGDFLAYNVFGIMFRVDDKHWQEISGQNDSQIVEMTVHIARFAGRIRLLIDACKIRSDQGKTIIFGKFRTVSDRRSIACSSKKCISMPICDALQQQYCYSDEWRGYTLVPPI